MKKNASIVRTAFNSIETVVSTVEAIHGNIAGITGNKNGSATRKGEKRKSVYDVIKSINGSIGTVVSDFLRQ